MHEFDIKGLQVINVLPECCLHFHDWMLLFNHGTSGPFRHLDQILGSPKGFQRCELPVVPDIQMFHRDRGHGHYIPS